MAFPLVVSLTPSTFGVEATAHNVAMPATVDAGDLLLCLFTSDGTATVTTPAGWTSLFSTVEVNNRVRASAFFRIASGTEDGTTVNFATSAAEQAAAQVLRITGWQGTAAGIEATGGAQGTSAAPNPPAETASWGAADNLWISYAGGSGTFSVTSYPVSYANGTLTSSGTGTASAQVASARRELNVSVDDPGAYTLSASSAWAAGAIVIRPAAASAAIVPAALTPSANAAHAAAAAVQRLAALASSAASASVIPAALVGNASPTHAVALRSAPLVGLGSATPGLSLVPTQIAGSASGGPALSLVPPEHTGAPSLGPSWVALPAGLAPQAVPRPSGSAVPISQTPTSSFGPALPAVLSELAPMAGPAQALAAVPGRSVPSLTAGPALVGVPAALLAVLGPGPRPAAAAVGRLLVASAAPAVAASVAPLALGPTTAGASAFALAPKAFQSTPSPEPSIGTRSIEPVELLGAPNPAPALHVLPLPLAAVANPRSAHAAAAAVLVPLAVAAGVALAIVPASPSPAANPFPQIGFDTGGPVVAVFVEDHPAVLLVFQDAPLVVAAVFDDSMASLICRRGDTWERTATFTFASGDLTGCKVWLTAKKRTEDSDAQALVQIDTDQGGIAILTGTTASFTIAADMTASFAPGVYVYDVQVRLPSGKSYTADSGSFTVQPDVTRAT